MARKRSIERSPQSHKNYFVVDANVLAYAALPRITKRVKVNISDVNEREKAERCRKWWDIIKHQLKTDKARVYVPDVCIAEAFKVLAKWYYRKKYFQTSISYNQAKKRLRNFVSTSHTKMAQAGRKVAVHDIATNRDIVIAVDRFFEPLYKGKDDVSVPDLIVLAVVKYLIDFYDMPREYLYILTCDRKLVALVRKISGLPKAINPSEKRYDPESTFI